MRNDHLKLKCSSSQMIYFNERNGSLTLMRYFSHLRKHYNVMHDYEALFKSIMSHLQVCLLAPPPQRRLISFIIE